MTTSHAASNESVVWMLRTTTLFENETESILDWAASAERERGFVRGDTLPLITPAGRFIYVMIDGKVKLRTVGEGGKEKILDVAGPGDTFGPVDRLVPSVRGESRDSPDGMAKEAVAISNGLALAYEFNEFRALMDRRPNIVVKVSRLLGLKQRQMEIRLNRLLFRSSLGKVAGLLSELAERYGQNEPGGVVLNLRLTHQEMASMIGVKRETVSECMAILELDEYLSTKGRLITVRRLAELDHIL